MPSSNVRYVYDAKRRRIRNMLRASGRPCAICGKPIDYSLSWYVDPKDGRRKRHPMSFEVDERIPVSRYREGGYRTPAECATDPENCQPAHRACNQRKGDGRRKSAPMPGAFPVSRVW